VSALYEVSDGGRQRLQHHQQASGVTSSQTAAASLVVKKRRKSRTAFTSYQLQQLERAFSRHKYLLPADRDVTARRLGLSSAQVCQHQLPISRTFRRREIRRGESNRFRGDSIS